MLIFGHPGITLGAALLLKTVLTGSRPLHPNSIELTKYPEPIPKTHLNKNALTGRRLKSLDLFSKIDVRLLLIGSFLPDIIDKPLGTFFLKDVLGNGRIYSHTLLFLLIITLAGFYLYRSHRSIWLLTLSFSTAMHLTLDSMWKYSHTLLWPLYGFAFEKGDTSHWIQNILYALFTEPRIYVPELIGLLILICFGLTLVRRRKFKAFLSNGHVLLL